MVRFLPFLISLVLTVYALFSCIQTRSEDVPYLPKLIWLALIVFVPFAGPITWLLVARTRGGSQRPASAGPRPRPVRPVAPDDDPDFLASLERYRDPRTTPLPPEARKGTDDSASGAAEAPEKPAGQGGRSGTGPKQANRRKGDPGADGKAPGGSGTGSSATGGSATGDSGTPGKAGDGDPETGPVPDPTTETDGGDGTRKP